MSEVANVLHALGGHEDASDFADMICRRVVTRARMVQRILPGEDVVTLRLAELWSQGETTAGPVVVWKKTDPPVRTVMIRRKDGTIENPLLTGFRR